MSSCLSQDKSPECQLGPLQFTDSIQSPLEAQQSGAIRGMHAKGWREGQLATADALVVTTVVKKTLMSTHTSTTALNASLTYARLAPWFWIELSDKLDSSFEAMNVVLLFKQIIT